MEREENMSLGAEAALPKDDAQELAGTNVTETVEVTRHKAGMGMAE